MQTHADIQKEILQFCFLKQFSHEMGTIVQNSLVYKRIVGSNFCSGSWKRLSLSVQMINFFFFLLIRFLRFLICPISKYLHFLFSPSDEKFLPNVYISYNGSQLLEKMEVENLHYKVIEKVFKFFPRQSFGHIFAYYQRSRVI